MTEPLIHRSEFLEHFETLFSRGDHREAIGALDMALEDLESHGEFRLATYLVCASMSAMVSAGHGLHALGWTERLIGHVDPTTNPGRYGRLQAARASALRGEGRPGEALEANHEALTSLATIAPDTALTTLRHDRAVLLAELGHADEAVTGLVAAREALLGARDRVGVAACDHNLSFVLHDLGALEDAAEYLVEARDIFLAIDMSEEAAACDQNLGVVLYDQGRFTDAGRRFAVAHNRFTKVHAPHSAAECDANLAVLLTSMGHEDEADRYRSRAEAAGVGIPSAPGASSRIPVVESA